MNARVLIVDDCPLWRAAAVRAAHRAGLDVAAVAVAGNGHEALAALAAASFDLVLLDLDMPVLDGIQFAEARMRMPALASVPVAMLGNGGTRQRRQRLAALGIVHYLPKPFEPQDLLALLAELAEPGG